MCFFSPCLPLPLGYTTDVFQDALLYSEHAGRTEVGLEDVRLAIQGRVNHSFTAPPPKEFLVELAEEKNKVPLPLIPEKYGIRLPHERHCLTTVNFQLTPEVIDSRAFFFTNETRWGHWTEEERG